MVWCRLQSQCFVKRLKLSTPTFIHDYVFPAISIIPPPFSLSISALTRLREGLQKRRRRFTTVSWSPLYVPQCFLSSNKACGTHFSASSVNIMCCLSSECVWVRDREREGERERKPQRIIGCGNRSRKRGIRLEKSRFHTAATDKSYCKFTLES